MHGPVATPLDVHTLGTAECPDNKVHGANMGPIWGRQDPGGPHVGPMNFAISVVTVGEARWSRLIEKVSANGGPQPQQPYASL